MKRIIRYFSFCAFAAVFLSVSCTNSKPEIAYGFLQMVMYQGDDGPQEYFTFFIIPEDSDGIDNLDELYLYHDREQLIWKMKSDEWINHVQDGKTWIGTRSLSGINNTLPSGVYRAVLVNKGGEKAERNFTFDAAVRHPFPELEISGGVYTVRSAWPSNSLVCYDRSGNFLSTIALTSLSGSVSDLKLPSGSRTAALWAEDEANFCSAFTNVVSLN